MRLRRPTYPEQQALWFLAACLILGGCLGVLIALLTPWRQ